MSAPIEPGQVLAGKYRVERVLGEGGMGVVVAATDVHLDRRVAVKFLLPAYAVHPDASKRFLREARSAVKIQSEHVARVIDVGTLETGAPFMVMEYLEGGDLTQVLEERGPLPVSDAVGYVLEACEAIAEAHSYGIVHRDLKPANLFLAKQPDGSSKIKVLDFGISKALVATDSGIDPSLTRTSSMMGSPLYMSPEQMRDAKSVDRRTDIWALGVILHELLSGDTPFLADTIPELSAKVLLEEPVKLSSVRADVPSDLADTIGRALAKAPAERHPTIAEFAIELLQFSPAHERTVERITKILRGAGLSTSRFEAAQRVSVAKTIQATHAQTAAAWSEAAAPVPAPPSKRKGIGVWLAAGAATVAAVVGGIAAFANDPTHDPTPASSSTPSTPTLVQGVPTTPDPQHSPPGAVPSASSIASSQPAGAPVSAPDSKAAPEPIRALATSKPLAPKAPVHRPPRRATTKRATRRKTTSSNPEPSAQKPNLSDVFGHRK